MFYCVIQFHLIPHADEYKGHCVLDACKTGNIPRLKKFLSSETVNFIHPYSGDTPLHAAAVSIDPKRKQVRKYHLHKLVGVINTLICFVVFLRYRIYSYERVPY